MFRRPVYDRVITVFSPDGRLFQVEYTLEAVNRGATILGITCPEGVVLGAEEKMEEIKGPTEAEVRAREYIRERHPKVRRILFKRVDRKGNAWLIEGDVWFQRLRLFTIKRTFRLRIDSQTGDVTSYQETRSGGCMQHCF